MTEDRADGPRTPRLTDDEVDHVGRTLRTLEHCALHRRTFRLSCPSCRHVRRIDAVPLWWLFVKRGWKDGLPQAMTRLCCGPCRDAGRVVRPHYQVTREQPDETQLAYPDQQAWKRIVSRYRS